jgi:hypothetical protein
MIAAIIFLSNKSSRPGQSRMAKIVEERSTKVEAADPKKRCSNK